MISCSAGHVTTQHTVTNAIYGLLTHPGQMAKLRADLSRMPAALDELMRYDGGVGVVTLRFTKEEVQIGNVTTPPDEILTLSILSAHRDESRYPRADVLDLDRCPLGGLGFGHGPHFCLGQPLARIESMVSVSKLLTRYPHLRLIGDPAQLQRENTTLLRGLLKLPVPVTPPG